MSTRLRTHMSTQARNKEDFGLLKGIKLYSEKEYQGLSQEQQEKYKDHVIKNILLNAKEGITVSEILSLVEYLGSKKTIQVYLERLVNTNVGYKKEIGNAYIYFPNGRLMHEVLEENVPIGKKEYSFIHLKNPEGEFISIQEKKRDDLNSLSLTGGIIISKDDFPIFMEHVQNIKKIIGGD